MFNTKNNGVETLSADDLAKFARLQGMGAQTPADDGRRFKIYLADFSVAIAAGANAQAQIRISSDHDFVVEDFRGDFRLSAASGAMVAGTLLPRDSSITLANNTALGNLGLVRLQFSLQQLEWASDPIPANQILGDSRAPGYLMTLPRIAASDVLTITAFNDTNETGAGVSLKGKISLFGYALPRNPISRT